MAKKTTILRALPSPGLAIFPTLIAQKQETLIMKIESFSRAWKICLFDGTPIMTISGESLSFSRRKTVCDGQGNQLCQIRCRKRGTYYAETSENGPKIWTLASKTGVFTTRTTASFGNVVNGGKPVDVGMKNSTSRSPSGVVRSGEVDIAVVEKQSWKMRTEYHITVAQGLDMFVPVALVMALDDRVGDARAAVAA
jgi:uncharacterized protein YxjI